MTEEKDKKCCGGRPGLGEIILGGFDEEDLKEIDEVAAMTGDDDHLMCSAWLEYLIGLLLEHTNKLIGITIRQLGEMTEFKKIELLERLYNDREKRNPIDSFLRSEIGNFLQKVNKEDFRTADDFE